MATPPISVENKLGPFRILRRLGEGGMGTVFLAYDDLLDRRVAIKVLRQAPVHRASDVRARRFLREARSAARINHPHVVTIYTVGAGSGETSSSPGQPFIVMEFVEGGSLAELLRGTGPLHWRDATRAIRDALRGLAAAHAQGVIHRDIKPGNLMRGRDASGGDLIKLVDFGLARVVAGPAGGAEELTFPGAFVGSPSYCAPEQAAGALIIDGRADLYALAATWYTLMTGQPPFVEDDAADLLQRHISDPFPDLRDIAPTVPPPLLTVMERASQKNPDDRYSGAAAMLAAVEKLLLLPDTVVAVPRQRHRRSGPEASSAHESVRVLEARLAVARESSDSSTQLEALRSLYGIYTQLNRRHDAQQAYRQALVLHIKLNAPAHN